MDIFDYMREERSKNDSPLAIRLRPESLDEFVGQEHILNKDSLLYRIIKADKLGSIILYGPPGTGKTTLAMVIAHTTNSIFEEINASTSGKKEMADVVDRAKNNLGMYGKKTILFIDEIHRFNKAQQDFLLPHVENGTVILIGATTENPYFEVNSALVSRSTVFELKPLDPDAIKKIITKAVYDKEKGLGAYDAVIDDDALEFLSEMAEGDARKALNAVELGILSSERAEDGRIHIDLKCAEECLQRRAIRYDKNGDNHYDIISAFIKSMRGSDPDAAVYYLAKMLYGGESVTFIARRIMICACEDVGNADPQAIQVATSCALAVERVGLPEAQIILAHAAIYVATAPKRNAVVNAIFSANEAVKKYTNAEVPPHLRDSHYSGSAELGHVGYKYAHDYPNHYVDQQYLPDALVDKVFYEPSEMGYEKTIAERLKGLKNNE